MTPSSIYTHGGRVVDPDRLTVEDIRIDDIAHALSNLCRFAGHTSSFYSVAEHSIRVSQMVPEPLKLEALLHDAAEAYIGDIARPLKSRVIIETTLGMSYTAAEYEDRILATIFRRFGLPLPLAPEVKEADDAMMQREIDSLIFSRAAMQPYPPRVAKLEFLREFNELQKRRAA